MKDWNPKSLWDELLEALRGDIDDGEEQGEQSYDPALVFHLIFTIPLLIGIVSLARRTL